MQIITGELCRGQKLLPVREMSVEYGVNPNTIQKALSELEEMGLIYTERTLGKYVTQAEESIDKVRNNFLKERVDEFCLKMNKLGLSKEQIIELIVKEKL